IGGLPLIRRTVLGAFRAGFERVLVMGGADATRLRHVLAADARTRGAEVLDGRPADTLGDGQVAVIPGDCVVTPATLARLRGASANGRCAVFEGDGARLALGPAARLAELVATGSSRPAADAEVASLDGEVCVRVTDDASARAAESRLLAEIRATTAASDG